MLTNPHHEAPLISLAYRRHTRRYAFLRIWSPSQRKGKGGKYLAGTTYSIDTGQIDPVPAVQCHPAGGPLFWRHHSAGHAAAEPSHLHPERGERGVFHRIVYGHLCHLRDGACYGGYLPDVVFFRTGCDLAPHPVGGAGLYDGHYGDISGIPPADRPFRAACDGLDIESERTGRCGAGGAPCTDGHRVF